jgi:hypothetical protein
MNSRTHASAYPLRCGCLDGVIHLASSNVAPDKCCATPPTRWSTTFAPSVASTRDAWRTNKESSTGQQVHDILEDEINPTYYKKE